LKKRATDRQQAGISLPTGDSREANHPSQNPGVSAVSGVLGGVAHSARSAFDIRRGKLEGAVAKPVWM